MITASARPEGLRWVTVAMYMLNLAAFIYPRPLGISAAVFLMAVGIFAGISFVVLWYFWRGRRWARWLVLATSVLAIVNLRLLRSAGSFETALLLANSVLGAWLLYWLNTRNVRAYFSKGVGAGAA